MTTNKAIELKRRIFSIENEGDFRSLALEVFRYQYEQNEVYSQFVSNLGIRAEKVLQIEQIPYLPISFFKSHKVISPSTKDLPELYFESSGTGISGLSRHYIADPSLYSESILNGFIRQYGSPTNYAFLALLPTYLDNPHSSLIYMVNELMKSSGHRLNGFFKENFSDLRSRILQCKEENQKFILWGVTYALLKFSDQYTSDLGEHAIVIETGGMKGHGKEMIREELHQVLKKKFAVDAIHSEYGMSELLSQAWCKDGRYFIYPPWMKIAIRDIYDPFENKKDDQSGAINVIDLANLHSCSFIATDDVGKRIGNKFEVLGRIDDADIRGCNLLFQE